MSDKVTPSGMVLERLMSSSTMKLIREIDHCVMGMINSTVSVSC